MTEDLWEAPCCRSPRSLERCQDCGNCPEYCECDPEDLIGAAKAERIRLKKEGMLEELQTPFGLLSVLHHPLLEPKPIPEVECQDCGEMEKHCKCERCQSCGELAEGYYSGGAPRCAPCYNDGE